MCYLVTWLNPPKTGMWNIRQTAIFKKLSEAQDSAEGLVLKDCTEVGVWKKLNSPKLQTSIIWETEQGVE